MLVTYLCLGVSSPWVLQVTESYPSQACGSVLFRSYCSGVDEDQLVQIASENNLGQDDIIYISSFSAQDLANAVQDTAQLICDNSRRQGPAPQPQPQPPQPLPLPQTGECTQNYITLQIVQDTKKAGPPTQPQPQPPTAPANIQHRLVHSQREKV